MHRFLSRCTHFGFPRRPALIIEQRHDVSDGDVTDQDHIIATPTINELIFAGPDADRVIPAIAVEQLTSAVPALQAIGIGAAIKGLIVAPARDQRVIAGIANKELISSGPALQAIGFGASIELLIVTPARDQRVIADIARELLSSAVSALQAIGTVAAIKVLLAPE